MNVILGQAEEYFGKCNVSNAGIASFRVSSAQSDRDVPIRNHADRTAIFHYWQRAAALLPKDLGNVREIRVRTAEADVLYHDILDFHKKVLSGAARWRAIPSFLRAPESPGWRYFKLRR
jgi:hypothetical protein